MDSGAGNEKVFLSVCAPAYNEEATIEQVVRAWAEILDASGQRGEIIIGNDGSTDRTSEILSRLQSEIEALRVVTLPHNRGYGAALSAALREASGRYVLTLDSDGQFDAAEYTTLLSEMEQGGFDVVTGYRRRKQDRLTRVAADRAMNVLVRGLFGLKLRDTNCALKLLRGPVAHGLSVEARGFPTPTEILVKAQTLGYRIGEVPVTHRERAGGVTKLKAFRTSWQILTFFAYLKLKQVLYRARVVNAF
jgi:glycosyltransferase involved in cell wall biosynthesis